VFRLPPSQVTYVFTRQSFSFPTGPIFFSNKLNVQTALVELSSLSVPLSYPHCGPLPFLFTVRTRCPRAFFFPGVDCSSCLVFLGLVRSSLSHALLRNVDPPPKQVVRYLRLFYGSLYLFSLLVLRPLSMSNAATNPLLCFFPDDRLVKSFVISETLTALSHNGSPCMLFIVLSFAPDRLCPFLSPLSSLSEVN